MKLKRNYVALALAGVLTIGTGMPSQAMVGEKVNYYKNEVTTTVKPVLISANIGIEDLAYQKDGFLMLPARLACEKLGFEVKWNGETQSAEISKNSIWTSIKLGEDSYFKGRTAPFPLGTAPELVNNSTYVPTEFFEEILGQDIFDLYEKNKVDGHVTNIMETKNGHMLTVRYGENQTIIFNVNNDTKITNSLTKKEMAVKDIVKGDRLIVIHDSKMTRSLPPQTYAFRIEVTQENKIEGEVTKINKTNHGHMVTIDYDENQTIIFHVNEETKITSQLTGKEITIEDVVVGNKLLLTHNNIFTMSIPAQTVAISIEVCIPEINEENIFRGDVTKIRQTDKATILTVVYAEKETVDFIVSDKTKIINQLTREEISVKNIVVGDKLILTHNNIMTASIPPQTNAIQIEVCYPIICPNPN